MKLTLKEIQDHARAKQDTTSEVAKFARVFCYIMVAGAASMITIAIFKIII